MGKRIEIPKEVIEGFMARHLTYDEMAEELGGKCTKWTVMNRAREYGLRSKARQHQQQTDNVVYRPGVSQKIADSIREKWAEGYYSDRVNGMVGIAGAGHPNYKEGNHYREKALFYHGAKCSRCGAPIDEKTLNIHHVDEDHGNFLLTNLEPLCVACHQKFHCAIYKQPYIRISKDFVFDAAHFLPGHPRKCQFLHGHSYHMKVTVRKRIDPKTGMVMDFGDLKKAVQENVIEPFDHNYLNDFIEFPTAENMLSWIWEALSVDVKGLDSIKLWETETSCAEMNAADALDLCKKHVIESEWLADDDSFEISRSVVEDNIEVRKAVMDGEFDV